MATVIVTVRPDGTTYIEAEGWTGPTCSTITEPYRKALGNELAELKKPEFFQVEQNTTQQEARQ